MSKRVDMSVLVGSIELPNPIVAAAGTFGHGDELSSVCAPDELGAITVKSLAAYPWEGNPPPRACPAPGGGMANSVGLSGPGVEEWMASDLPALVRRGARIIVSIWGRSAAEFEAAAAPLADCAGDLVAVEVNASCPNLEDRRGVFAHSAEATQRVVGAVRSQLPASVPVLAKLSPNVTDIRDIAESAVRAGATGLTLVNTVMGLVVDVEQRVPALGAGPGGISGPPIRPIALRAVWEVHRAMPEVPIIGTGGVASGEHAAEMMLVGASAVGVGTATFVDPRATIRIRDGLRRWCARRGVHRVADLTGSLEA